MKRLAIASALVLATLTLPVAAAIEPRMGAIEESAYLGKLPPGLLVPAVETVVTEPQPPPPPNGKVVVNVGEWLDVLQEFFLAIFTLVLTAVIGMLPYPIRAVVLTWRVNQMATQAARLGLARAKEKLKAALGPDGTITIPVKNAAVEMGAEYALDYANQQVSEFAGGKNGWKDKVLARIEELLASVLTEYKEAPHLNVVAASTGKLK